MIPIKIECECGQHYAFDVEPTNGRMPSSIACPACGVDGTSAANESIARLIPANSDPIRVVSLPSSVNAAPTLPPALVAAMPAAPIPSPTPSAPPAATATQPGPVRLATEPVTIAPSHHALHLATPAVPIQMEQPASPPAATPSRTRRPDPRLGQVDRDQAQHEARAKAMWGDSKDQITGYLLGQGFSYPEAQEITEQLFKERASAVRANGIRKIIIGSGLTCVPIIALIIFLAIHFIPLKLFAITVMIGLYGLWLVINGILMAVAPKSERGDVADQ